MWWTVGEFKGMCWNRRTIRTCSGRRTCRLTLPLVRTRVQLLGSAAAVAKQGRIRHVCVQFSSTIPDASNIVKPATRRHDDNENRVRCRGKGIVRTSAVGTSSSVRMQSKHSRRCGQHELDAKKMETSGHDDDDVERGGTYRVADHLPA